MPRSRPSTRLWASLRRTARQYYAGVLRATGVGMGGIHLVREDSKAAVTRILLALHAPPARSLLAGWLNAVWQP